MAEAGSRPGGRSPFLCFAKEKDSKERRPCWLRPLRCAAGQPGSGRWRGGPQNSLRCCAASFKQLRPVSSRSGCILRCSRHPASTPTQAHPEGSGSPHGPSLRSALGVGCHRMRCNWLANSTPLDPPELDLTEPARSPPRRWLQSQKEKRGWGKPTWEAAPAAAKCLEVAQHARAPRPSAAMARVGLPTPLDVPRSAAGEARGGTEGCPRFVI